MSIAKLGGVATKTLLMAALLAGLMASVLFVAQAASLTAMTLSLSNAEPGATSVDYSFAWTESSNTTKGIKIQLCQEASGSCTTPTGDFSIAAASLGAGTFSAWSLAVTADTIQLTDATGTTDTGITQVISGIVNTGTSGTTTPIVFFARITTYSDTGLTSLVDGTSVVASAVIPVISVSGTQDAILQMTVDGLAVASGPVDITTKVLSAAATATSLPFGNFVPLGITSPTPSSRAVAQNVNVVTNGVTGYTATVIGGSVAMTRSGGSDTIGYLSADTKWVEGGGGTSGFGVSAEGTQAPSTFNDDGDVNALEYEPINSSLTIASNGSPTNGTDTTVIFRVQVDATTPAGDYAGNVNYTVLPNF